MTGGRCRVRGVRWAGKRAAAAIATACLTAALSGCVVFKGPVTAEQVGKKPKVAVKFTLCNSDDGHEEPVCPNDGNSDEGGVSGAFASGEEVLLGLRVPNGTETPERIRSRTPGVEGAFRPLGAYTRQLNLLAPRREGFRWRGYSGSPLHFENQGNDTARYDRAKLRVVLGVPDRLVGDVFRVRPVAGWYDDSDDPAGLDCGPDPFEWFDDGRDNRTICIDSPSPRKTRSSVRVRIEPRA